MKSYIDHIMIPLYLCDTVNNCRIKCNDQDNVSDHYPVFLDIDICIPSSSYNHRESVDPSDASVPVFPKPRWNNLTFMETYQRTVDDRMNQIHLIPVAEVNKSNVLLHVNRLYGSVCTAMHDSVKLSLSHLPKRKYRHKSWWNQNCHLARDRNRTFHHIWKRSGRPTKGLLYECYKSTRKAYRKCCRQAVKSKKCSVYEQLTTYYIQRNSKMMWNIIRKTKRKPTQTVINKNKLECYFRDKFSVSDNSTTQLKEAGNKVSSKFMELTKSSEKCRVISEATIRKYVKKLKSGLAAGIDGITGEHLKNARHTRLSLLLSQLLTICVQYGVLPDKFCEGILVPIMKKTTLDPACAESYRPITLSVVISKILEQYI